MPVGTIINSQSDKIELKTCPGGYVIVRRMTYGEELQRSSMATKLTVGGSGKDATGMVDIQTDKIAYWDFANLIVEHNITDANERLLDFKREQDVKMLSGPIGTEIGQAIDDFNSVKETEEVKN